MFWRFLCNIVVFPSSLLGDQISTGIPINSLLSFLVVSDDFWLWVEFFGYYCGLDNDDSGRLLQCYRCHLWKKTVKAEWEWIAFFLLRQGRVALLVDELFWFLFFRRFLKWWFSYYYFRLHFLNLGTAWIEFSSPFSFLLRVCVLCNRDRNKNICDQGIVQCWLELFQHFYTTASKSFNIYSNTSICWFTIYSCACATGIWIGTNPLLTLYSDLIKTKIELYWRYVILTSCYTF